MTDGLRCMLCRAKLTWHDTFGAPTAFTKAGRARILRHELAKFDGATAAARPDDKAKRARERLAKALEAAATRLRV